jgi:hypothetical protein
MSLFYVVSSCLMLTGGGDGGGGGGGDVGAAPRDPVGAAPARAPDVSGTLRAKLPVCMHTIW